MHRRLRCRRTAFRHQLTTTLAQTQSVIGVEDLSVRGMIRNRHRARALADAGWSEFRRMLSYQTAWYGSRLIVAPRFYPSTKRGSACGAMQYAMPLAERVFRCAVWGAAIDRDLDAARNLASLVAGSAPGTLNACGGEGSGQEHGLVTLAPTKQEPSSRKLAAKAAGNQRL